MKHQRPAAKTTNSNCCDRAVAQVRQHIAEQPGWKNSSERTASTEQISKKGIKLILKTIGNRKGDCAWSCSRWQTQPEKICKLQSTNQYNVRSEWHWFVRCDLQIFSGCVCHLEQLHAQSPFLFPIVFNIIGSAEALPIVREWLLWEGERERERERDACDVIRYHAEIASDHAYDYLDGASTQRVDAFWACRVFMHLASNQALPSPRTRPNPCWYGDDWIWAWGPVKIDAYVSITFSKLSAKIWLTDNASFAREPTWSRTSQLTRARQPWVGIGARACWRCWTPRRHWCCMSFVLDGSSLRCRGVLNQLFVAVNFATPWRWKPSCEGASKLSWPEIISLPIYQQWFREVTDLSGASFCLWRPEWWHTGIVKKKKKNSGSLAHFLSPSLQSYRIMLLSFLKKKKEKKGRREDLPAAEKTDICAFWYKPFGLHFVSSIQVWNCERRSFHSAKGIYVRKARVVIQQTTDRRGVFFSLNVTPPLLGLWRAIPRVGELPFLKGFSLWTDQSERVYFYWPPGPNPVVTISTRVGPGSRLEAIVLVQGLGFALQQGVDMSVSWPLRPRGRGAATHSRGDRVAKRTLATPPALSAAAWLGPRKWTWRGRPQELTVM